MGTGSGGGHFIYHCGSCNQIRVGRAGVDDKAQKVAGAGEGHEITVCHITRQSHHQMFRRSPLPKQTIFSVRQAPRSWVLKSAYLFPVLPQLGRQTPSQCPFRRAGHGLPRQTLPS